MDYKLFWSDESLDNLKGIISYLESEWSEKEVVAFKKKLSRQLDLIVMNPKLFPVSDRRPRLRKAVLSKQTTIFYELKFRGSYCISIQQSNGYPKDKMKHDS
jgi:plasmid stabilization system protein ParE